MDYKLAKQLKDVGFPQENTDQRKMVVNENNSDCAFPPTLSELIDACGENFDSLNLGEDGWYCIHRDVLLDDTEYKTPEEAHEAYKQFKSKHILEVAESYKNESRLYEALKNHARLMLL